MDVKQTILQATRDIVLNYRPAKLGELTRIDAELCKLNPTLCDDGDTGKIAFGPDNKRTKLRTARFLTRKLNLHNDFLNDVEIRTIQTNIDDILFDTDDLVKTFISTGEDIRDNYSNDVGGSSCMSGNCSDYVGLYVDNPDVYSQLIMTRGNDSARAMVVKLDNGEYLLDRIYTDAEDLVIKMENYADKQGWLKREHLSGNDMQLIVTGLIYIDGEVPYQDTLDRGRIRDGLLDLMADTCHDYDFTVDNTDGSVEGGYVCDNCGCHLVENEARRFNDYMYCECCFDDIAFSCVNCNNTHSIENGILIESLGTICEGCYCEDYTRCEICDEHVLQDDSRFVESTEQDVCNNCLEHHFQQCPVCNEYFEFGGMVRSLLGEVICWGCLENSTDPKKAKHNKLIEYPGQMTFDFRDDIDVTAVDFQDRIVAGCDRSTFQRDTPNWYFSSPLNGRHI